MYAVGLCMLAWWMFLIFNQELIFKIDFIFPKDFKLPMMILFLTFILFMFWPCRHLFHLARWELVKAWCKAAISPFDEVKFRTFLFATS